MKKRIIAMVLSVAMMLTMFPTGVLADDFIENTEGVTVSAEGQSNDDQGEESDTAQLNAVENEETQPETVKPENDQTEPGQTENGQTEPTQNETDQAAPDQTETDQTEQPEPGSTVPDQAGTTPDDKQPAPEQPATDPAENGVSDGAENTEGEQAESKTEFTVTWESEGETILTKTFAEGTSKDEVEDAQPAEDPVKEADGDVAYEFAGWTPDYADVTADQTYTAKFEEAEQDEMVSTASLVEPAADIHPVEVGKTCTLTGAFSTWNDWKSSDTSIATVAKDYLGYKAIVTGKKAGFATITHTYGRGDTETFTVKVVAADIASNEQWAQVYYLKDPDKFVTSNDASNFGDLYDIVKVDTTNMPWDSDGKNYSGDGIETRVIDWQPYGYAVVPEGEHWDAIFNNFKESKEEELGVTIEKDDVTQIRIVPAKISHNNGTTPDYHVDCNVEIYCKDVATVRYFLKDAGAANFNPLGAKSYVINGESVTNPTDIQGVTMSRFPAEKIVDGVRYKFVGWQKVVNGGHAPTQVVADTDFGNTESIVRQSVTGNADYYAEYVPVAKLKVTYDLDGGNWQGTAPAVAELYEGETYTVTSVEIEKQGYTFGGWKLDEGTTYQAGDTFTMPGSDVVLVAQWTPHADTAYTVEHYQQNVADDEYTLADTDNKTGTTGEKTAAEAKSYTGFTVKEFTQTTINADGSTVVKIYYDRNTYTVTYTDGVENEDVFADQVNKDIRYGAETPAFNGKPSRTGYDFAGWDSDVAETVTDNVTYTATWEKRTDLSYTVKYQWNGQPIEGKTPKTVVGQTFGSEVTEEPIAIEGYSIKPNQSGKLTITANSEKNVIIFNYYKNVTLTANSNEKPYIYDGKAKEVKDYTASDNAATFEDITARGTGTNAGKYDVKFAENPVGKISTDDKYIVTAATDGTLTINKRQVSLTSVGGSKTYDGTPLVEPKVIVGGDGFVADEVTDIRATGSVTNVSDGEVTNAITYTTGANFKESNYDIAKTEGKLHIDPVTDEVIVSIKGDIANGTYNGSEQTLTTYTVTSNNSQYSVNAIKFVGENEPKAVGINAGKYELVLNADDFENTDQNFATVRIGTTNGKLVIARRKVTLSSESDSKPYDGTALTKPVVTVTDSGFVDGEVANLRATGSVTNVSDGKVLNKIEYDTIGNFNADNYLIYPNEGELYITPVTDEVTVTITGNTDTVTYNGKEQSVEGYKVDSISNNLYKDTDFTFTGEAKATGTDANTYAMGLAENQFANTSANFTNVKFSVEDGWLTINPLEGVVVTITGNTKTVPYNGKEQSVEGYTVAFTKNPGDLYKDTDFKPNYEAKAAGTDAGTYSMGFVATSFENINPNFKNIVFNITDGWLKITPKEIVPGENNKDLTATAPEDVVYSGESQQQKPIVKDGDKVLEEGKDYTLTYSEDTTNAGTVTVTISGNGNYGSKFDVTYKITPAPLKITTNSAEKTYDGSALTAGGKIEGLVKDETATLKTTGSQTEVGESKNTYEIEWDGTAKETNYKIAEEDIGTLKVNARSGGGSSKPTPEEEPTPTPTPTPLPTLPTTPAPTTPARRVTRSTATVTEPASRPTEQITENETPKAESEPEVIEDEETPLAPMAGGAWALVNLILMLLTVLASLLLLLGYLGKKKYAKEDEYGNALHDANGNEIIDYTRNKKGFWRVASLIPAIAAVIAFALTENMRLPMVMTDRWTLLMVIIAVVQLIVAVLCKKKKESEEDENQANA